MPASEPNPVFLKVLFDRLFSKLNSISCNVGFTFLYTNTTLQTKIDDMEAIRSQPRIFLHLLRFQVLSLQTGGRDGKILNKLYIREKG